MKIISRAEAYRLGIDRYFTGEPCVKGHIAERLTKNWTCVKCNNEMGRDRRKKPEVKERKRARIHAKRVELLGEKPDQCPVCGDSTRPIRFDHSHATGRARGWICDQCNRILGMVNDDPEVLRKLATYLGT